MLMLPAYPSESQGQGPSDAVIEALPMWQEAGESGDHRQYIFHYHTMMCPQFANGYCPRHKGSRSAPPQCFCYHFESQRRRPLVDTLTGQLRYWDVLCERVAEGEECACGDLCPFAHTREEISYHAAKYKTKFCNDRDCRGQEVCCFAHGEAELRVQALERYSYWSVFGGGGPGGPTGALRAPHPSAVHDMALVAAGPGSGLNGRGNATGALYHPKVYKHRFCASYPHVAGCRRGDVCAFAHSRDEIRTPLLAGEEEDQRPSALTNDFFMYRFKTLWCPVGVQHDWQTCVYAHNYQDARRHPGIGYGPRPCPYWKRKETALEYSQRCPLGVRCPFSHGAKEQLYHPTYFKTVTCQDWPNSNCPRGKLCAFWHKRSQQRARPSSEDEFNYKQPIAESRLEESLQGDFLSPPFKLLNTLDGQQDGQPLDGSEQVFPFQEQGMAQAQDGSCQAWPSTQICSYNGTSPATPTTTAADSDEAASADSGSWSDKTPVVRGDQHYEDEHMHLGLSMHDGQMLAPDGMPWVGHAAGQWNIPAWKNDGMAMQGFAPSGPHAGPGSCAMGQPMMCYVQVQPSGPSCQPQMQPAGAVAGVANPPCLNGVPSQAPQQLNGGAAGPCNLACAPMVEMQALQPPRGELPDWLEKMRVELAMGPQAGGMPPCAAMQSMQSMQSMQCWGGVPDFSGYGDSYNFGYMSCPDVSYMGATQPGMMRPIDMGAVDTYNFPALTTGEASCEGDAAWAPSASSYAAGEEDMPTYNGFIHFKETEEADPEAACVGRRPRAASH